VKLWSSICKYGSACSVVHRLMYILVKFFILKMRSFDFECNNRKVLAFITTHVFPRVSDGFLRHIKIAPHVSQYHGLLRVSNVQCDLAVKHGGLLLSASCSTVTIKCKISASRHTCRTWECQISISFSFSIEHPTLYIDTTLPSEIILYSTPR
jgi:hypothetical protein